MSNIGFSVDHFVRDTSNQWVLALKNDLLVARKRGICTWIDTIFNPTDYKIQTIREAVWNLLPRIVDAQFKEQLKGRLDARITKYNAKHTNVQTPLLVREVMHVAARSLPIGALCPPSTYASSQKADLVPFITTLAGATKVNKEETVNFMVNHRQELGQLVTRRDIRPEEIPHYTPIKIDGKTVFQIEVGGNSYQFEENSQIYELRENPSDGDSEVIGFVRTATKTKAKSIDEFMKLRDRSQKSIEIVYLKVSEKYRNKGFAYILLHRAISDGIADGKSVRLLDQSDFKGTNLYMRVGNYIGQQGETARDFEHFSHYSQHTYRPLQNIG